MHNKILYLYIIMQTNKKTIKITPGLFNNNTKTKKKKKKPNVRVNTKTRNELIRKLKNKQNKLRKNKLENEKNKKNRKSDNKVINTTALDESFKVLEELYNKHKKKRNERKRLKREKMVQSETENVQSSNFHPKRHMHNMTIKNRIDPHIHGKQQNEINVYTELPNKLRDANIPNYNIINPINIPPIVLKPNPPYGCLKNGNKPTYRNWQINKTMKNNKFHTPNLQQHISNREMILNKIKLKIKEQREKIQREKLEKLKSNGSTFANNILNKKIKKIKKHIRTLKRKIKKKTYKLGKKDKKVSVLIKNNKTRKKIQGEQILLRKKKIHDIKSELIESGLLKYGSIAPNYLIRSLYENAILSGDVKNTSDGVLLHNYMSK